MADKKESKELEAPEPKRGPVPKGVKRHNTLVRKYYVRKAKSSGGLMTKEAALGYMIQLEGIAEQLGADRSGREISLAQTKAEEAALWLTAYLAKQP